MSGIPEGLIDHVAARLRDYSLDEITHSLRDGKVYLAYRDSRIIAEMAMEEYERELAKVASEKGKES